MTVDEIVKALVCPETFPQEVIAEAMARREELAPVFMEMLGEWTEKRGYPKSGSYYVSSFVFYLLAEWRETSAFKPILRFIATPQADHLLGDDITQNGGLLLSRLYDGDHAALEALVLDENADEFVRDAALDCYVRVAQDGIVPRAQVRAFVERLLAELPRESSFMWIAVINAVSSLGWRDLTPKVTQMFETGLADPKFMNFEDFAGDLDKAERGEFFNRHYDGDLIEAMRRWLYAKDVRESEEKRRLRRDSVFVDEELKAAEFLYGETPTINEFRGVGRNDPCPCGSGKKFKKCCLPKVEAGEM